METVISHGRILNLIFVENRSLFPSTKNPVGEIRVVDTTIGINNFNSRNVDPTGFVGVERDIDLLTYSGVEILQGL